MPRTRVPKKKPAPQLAPWKVTALAELEIAKQSCLDQLDYLASKSLDMLRTQLNISKCSIPAHLLNKTIGELSEHPLNWSGNTTNNASIAQVLDVTKSMATRKKQLTRSSSFADDEGYLTAEASSTSGGRTSRARSRQPKTSRISRSLSTRNQSTIKSNKFKTPAQKIPPNTYGTVTPKMKPNTPQVLLRRPKQGEVALSLQGSPLLTGGVVTDNVANINIPLDDGRLLSIQPQRGLRLSQIPLLDGEIKRQLETLRDNLNTVCALSGTKN